MDERFERYVTELFAAEDPILSQIRARHTAENLPAINVSPEEGKLLHLLLRTIEAKRVLARLVGTAASGSRVRCRPGVS